MNTFYQIAVMVVVALLIWQILYKHYGLDEQRKIKRTAPLPEIKTKTKTERVSLKRKPTTHIKPIEHVKDLFDMQAGESGFITRLDWTMRDYLHAEGKIVLVYPYAIGEDALRLIRLESGDFWIDGTTYDADYFTLDLTQAESEQAKYDKKQ